MIEVDLVAVVVYVDPRDMAVRIVIQNNSLLDFTAVRAGPGRQIDVERIGVLVVIQFHFLNLLSGKALCIVVLSSRMTPRRIRLSSS